MTETNGYSRPAGAGLPETADDDSHADPALDAIREADGPAPAPLPPDREDGPLALDEFGTTAEEQRQGESLDGRLAREEPEAPSPGAAPHPPGAAGVSGAGGLAGAGGALGTDAPEEIAMHEVAPPGQVDADVLDTDAADADATGSDER